MDWTGLDPTQKASPLRAPYGANNFPEYFVRENMLLKYYPDISQQIFEKKILAYPGLECIGKNCKHQFPRISAPEVLS